MKYNELIEMIKEKVKNGEPIHGWMRDVLIDYELDNNNN